MKAAVYGCDNIAKIVELPDIESILGIFVDIVSGDEIVTFYIKDQKPIKVDSCSSRRLFCSDESMYCVNGYDNIRRWLNYAPTSNCYCAAYERRDQFVDYD